MYFEVVDLFVPRKIYSRGLILSPILLVSTPTLSVRTICEEPRRARVNIVLIKKLACEGEAEIGSGNQSNWQIAS